MLMLARLQPLCWIAGAPNRSRALDMRHRLRAFRIRLNTANIPAECQLGAKAADEWQTAGLPSVQNNHRSSTAAMRHDRNTTLSASPPKLRPH
jgi:hypothetical protein